MSGGAAVSAAKKTDVPSDVEGLRQALITQRDYTLAVYADLPLDYWDPRHVPFEAIINPPCWELPHIAWFQEFFALRWRADDVKGIRTPSSLEVADQLFDSTRVTHRMRWNLAYPSRDECTDYMQRVLKNVVAALEKSSPDARYGFQLALLHEDMHAEALGMTLVQLELPAAAVAPDRVLVATRGLSSPEISCGGGLVQMGAKYEKKMRAFRFDNENPGHRERLPPFKIDSRVVSAGEFAVFVASDGFWDQRYWSVAGNAWRENQRRQDQRNDADVQRNDFAAMHVNFYAAEAYCHWKNRRLPTEAEWEYAATSSNEFLASTGHVWEWTASPFAPYPGFKAERYREYSEPWFASQGILHRVLKGGSFMTHPRLKYPQFRNFYTPERADMFCGFRTCAIT